MRENKTEICQRLFGEKERLTLENEKRADGRDSRDERTQKPSERMGGKSANLGFSFGEWTLDGSTPSTTP